MRRLHVARMTPAVPADSLLTLSLARTDGRVVGFALTVGQRWALMVALGW